MDLMAFLNNQLADGQALVSQLRDSGIEVVAACWVQINDDERWYLYIASPMVDRDGIAAAYARVHEIIRQLPESNSVDPFEVKMISPRDPIAVGVVKLHQAHPPKFATRFRGTQLGGVSIEAAYIYPPP